MEARGGSASVFAGTLLGATSPAPYFSELVGADLHVHAGHALSLPLTPAFEHALLVLDGDVALNGQGLEPRMLYYLGLGRSECSLASRHGGRALLIGGPPFPEPILMWWNFVARTPEELAAARTDWEGHRRFGDVRAYAGPRLAAPALVRAVRPEPVS
jgi:redox-sensitive bicupin YhaK (pirin superfamily)